MFSKRTQGFTLLEILVVIVIIGILSTAAFTSYQNSLRNARDNKRKADLELIAQALEKYRSDNGYYPLEGECDSSYVYLNPDVASCNCKDVAPNNPPPNNSLINKCNLTFVTEDRGWDMEWPESLDYDSCLTKGWSKCRNMPPLELSYLKELPKDPINNDTYFYDYEGYGTNNKNCSADIIPNVYCTTYELHARLETTGGIYKVRSPQGHFDY